MLPLQSIRPYRSGNHSSYRAQRSTSQLMTQERTSTTTYQSGPYALLCAMVFLGLFFVLVVVVVARVGISAGPSGRSIWELAGGVVGA